MKIAIHNLQYLPQLINRGGINNYVLELLKQGKIDYLFFDQNYFNNHYGIPLTKTIRQISSMYSFKDLGLDKTEIIFSPKSLFAKADVLLNFNGVIDTDMTKAVRDFSGLKIFHLMDYFWVQPASQQYQKLKDFGADYLMSYGSPDKYDNFFQSIYKNYIGKVIPIPYGFSPRFKNLVPFENRQHKCVALGSVNPLKRPDSPEPFWMEPYKFFTKEKWMHKFRHMLVDNRKKLSHLMDSYLPVYPEIADHGYNIVKVFNDYQMYTTCESIYYFPTAKSFEGPAAGCVQICSTHPCFTDLGFVDGVNCIKHKELNVGDFKSKVSYYLKNQNKLKKIQEKGTKFVLDNYSHPAVARKLYSKIEEIYNRNGQSSFNTSFVCLPRQIVLKNYLITKILLLISFLEGKISPYLEFFKKHGYFIYNTKTQ